MIFTSALAIAHILAQIPMGGITGGTAAAPWTFKQSVYFDSRGSGSGSNCSNTGATCTVNVTSIGSGHILIVYGQNDAGSPNALSSVSGETWTDCTACQSLSTSIQIDVQYVLSATGGETSFTCNFNSAPLSYESCAVIELAHSGTVSFDTGGTTNSNCASPCSGVGLTLAGTSEAVIQLAIPNTTLISSVSSPYTSMCLNNSCGGPSSAYLLNTSSGSAPTWTYTGSQNIVLSALAISGAAAPWSFIQSKFWDSFGGTGGSGCASSTNTCTVTVSSIGAGHVLIVYGYSIDTNANGLSSINGETITDCSACKSTNTSFTQADIGYVLSTTGGETSITCTFSDSSSTYMGCGIIELSKTSSATFDTGNVTTSSGCGASCSGLALTISGSQEAIIQVIAPHIDNASAITGGYTLVCSGSSGGGSCDGFGTAYLLNTSSGSAPTWTLQSNQQITANAIAIK